MRRLALALAFPVALSAQPAPTFTAEDALHVTTHAIGDLSDDGRWLATLATLRRDNFGADYKRDGDPTYLRVTPVRLSIIDTRSGARTEVFKDKRPVRNVRWAPDGNRLAMLILEGEFLVPTIYDRTTGKSRSFATLRMTGSGSATPGRYVAENSDIRWSADGQQLIVSTHSLDWRKKARDNFASITSGPVIVQNSKDPFLAWDDVRRAGNMRSVVAIDVATGRATERVPETMVANYTVAEDGSAIAFSKDIQKRTDYESFNSETALHVRDAAGFERVLRPTTRGMQIQWAEDGKRYAYSNNGRVYLASIGDTTSKLIAGAPEGRRGETPDTSKAARDKAALERFTVVRYSPAGDAVLVSNREGLWLTDVGTGAKEKVVASSDSNDALPRVAFAGWSPDGKLLYLTSNSRQVWERGILRYDRSTRELKELAKDNRQYSGFRLSKDGSTIVVNIANGNRPADVYVADANLGNMRRLVETNPQLAARRFGATELMNYLDADGHVKKAVVYYPADYVKGQPHPTVFEIYEDYFDDTFDVRANVLTGSGYVVVKPSVDFDIGFPGEAWLKGVTAAANKMIELGVADSARLGVQGQSYGGYATNLLVTQTGRFKAAVNISGKVDMISFYTDSPRLGIRNINAAERTQDRLGATLWAQPQKYVAHSAIMFADRITTPLLLVTGNLDSNVPADNTREMYYALRRLGKEVIWVNYANGGHGGGTYSPEDFLDMHRRVLEFYDSNLKAPKGKLATN